MPQIRFALARIFAVSGWITGLSLPRTALEDSLVLGYIYVSPQQPVKGVLNVGASPTRRIKRFTTEQPDACLAARPEGEQIRY